MGLYSVAILFPAQKSFKQTVEQRHAAAGTTHFVFTVPITINLRTYTQQGLADGYLLTQPNCTHNYPPGKVLLYRVLLNCLTVFQISCWSAAREERPAVTCRSAIFGNIGKISRNYRQAIKIDPVYQPEGTNPCTGRHKKGFLICRTHKILCILQMRNQFKLNLPPYSLHFALF